ncbi:MAG: lytic murein transglycosylase, partial [Rhizobiales bacterium]|nr:lytic murein transglycosylase [Hyphomicrobiales bacterium]
MVRSFVLSSTLALTVGLSAMSQGAQAQEAPCGGNFDRWLKQVRAEAGQMGISRQVISSALSGLTPDPRVLSRDRRQGVFSQTFLKFSSRMISKNRMNRGRQLMKQHRSTFKRVRKEFGVPSSVLTAFWGLETDFGGYMGDFKTLRSLVTLAHDCRRPELFRPQVFDAMRLLERGDLSLSQMVGAWAGELGQTQFLPSDYLEIALDYDRDGRVDLIRSVPDVLGSTGRLVQSFGWRAGEPWLQEVRVPRSMPWDQADIAIKH